MEPTTAGQFLIYATVLGLICSITTTLLAIIQTKAAIANLKDGRKRTGLTISCWLVTILFFIASISHSVMTNPAVIGHAFGGSNASQQNSCPCPDASKPEEQPSQKAGPAAPKSSATPTKIDAQGLHFLVDNRRTDYSPNALMGKFEGSITVGTDGITLSMPNPVLKLAGNTPNWGDRDIVSIQAAVDEYGDLSKISKSSKMRGDAAWSEPFELKGVVCSNGEDCTIQQTVKLFIPGQFSNVPQKALLIKINNKYAGTRNEIFPGYVLGDRNIFSGR